MSTFERWAPRRAPTRCWLAVPMALLLLACGGNDGPTVLATTRADAQGGDERTGAAVLVLPLPGPVLQLDAPATVRVRIKAQLQQSAHYAAGGSASLALQEPAPSGASAVALRLAAQATTRVAVAYSVDLPLPAGRTPLLALLTVRAVDAASGLPSGALARAEAQADWVVEGVRP